MDTDYNKHAIIFFKSYKNNTNNYIKYNFEYDSLQYVRKQDDIMKKDRLDAVTLIGILERLKYLKFEYTGYKDCRFHSITSKGIDFLNEINSSDK